MNEHTYIEVITDKKSDIFYHADYIKIKLSWTTKRVHFIYTDFIHFTVQSTTKTNVICRIFKTKLVATNKHFNFKLLLMCDSKCEYVMIRDE